MANCCDMKEGDLFFCDTCGLELTVKKACTCSSESEDACSVPLMCCGKEMTKKEFKFVLINSMPPEDLFLKIL